MDEHKRAEKLCIEAEKLGLDAPTEAMIAEEIMHAISEQRLDIELSLEQAGFKDAANALHRWQKLKYLDEADA